MTARLPGANLGALPSAGGISQFNISNYSGYGYAYPALVYNDPVFQYTGNANWTRGKHTIRFGVDVSQQHMNHIEVQPTAFSFTGGVTSLNGGSAASSWRCWSAAPCAGPSSPNWMSKPSSSGRAARKPSKS